MIVSLCPGSDFWMINSTGEADGLPGSVQLMSNSSQAVAERGRERGEGIYFTRAERC